MPPYLFPDKRKYFRDEKSEKSALVQRAHKPYGGQETFVPMFGELARKTPWILKAMKKNTGAY